MIILTYTSNFSYISIQWFLNLKMLLSRLWLHSKNFLVALRHTQLLGTSLIIAFKCWMSLMAIIGSQSLNFQLYWMKNGLRTQCLNSEKIAEHYRTSNSSREKKCDIAIEIRATLFFTAKTLTYMAVHICILRHSLRNLWFICCLAWFPWPSITGLKYSDYEISNFDTIVRHFLGRVAPINFWREPISVFSVLKKLLILSPQIDMYLFSNT